MSPVAVMILLLAAVAGALAVLVLRRRRTRPRAPGHYVVIDGSNVMYWRGDAPELEPVLDAIAELSRQGFTPGVVFDANAGWKLFGRYQHDQAMARRLGLPPNRVMVVPKGVVADTWILAAARDLDARIVTNDRYRDHAAQHPEVSTPGHMIRGGYRDGKLWLEDVSRRVP